MRVGVAIITYRSADHIWHCLASLQPYADCLKAGVLVIDNASDDATCEKAREHPGVRLVANARNLGFAGAANQAFRLLPDAEAILLLNPDLQVQRGLEHLADAMERTGAGAVSGLLLHPDGRPQRGFAVRRFPTPAALAFETLGLNRLIPSNPVNRRLRALDLDLSVEQEVEQPAGAFLLIRREAWQAAGGFDEGFHPAWFEDVDFLLRLGRAGWRIRLHPGATAIHAGGHSFTKVSWSQRQLVWYGNLLRYAAIHFGPAGRRVVAVSVLISAVPRALTGMLRERSLTPLWVYSRIVGFAVRQVAGREGVAAGGVSPTDNAGRRPWLSGS